MNIAHKLLASLAEYPDNMAIVEGGGRCISRAQIDKKIRRRASGLVEAGLRPGQRVIVQAPPGIELAVSALSVLVAGGVLVLMEANAAPALYLRQAACSAANWFLVDRKLHWIQSVPGLVSLLRQRGIGMPPAVEAGGVTRLVSPLAGETVAKELLFAVETGDEADAVIVFTGGTTQEPSAVRLSHRAVGAYLSSISDLVAGHTINCFIADTPQQILYGLFLGVGVWVPRGRGSKRARSIIRCLSSGEADMYFGPPSAWKEIMAQVKRDNLPPPQKLSLVMLGGAPVSNVLLSQLSHWLPATTEVRVLYGLSEVGSVSSCTASSRLHWESPGDLMGAPLPTLQLAINAPGGDGVGELVVSGPSVYSGYLGRGPSNGRLYTGDLARLVEFEGTTQLVLMGRVKDMIIRRGVNIYPLAVEPIILKTCDQSGVLMLRDCALVGIWDPVKEDEHLVLFYVPDTKKDFTPSFLQQRLRGALGEDYVPDTCMKISQIPGVGRQHKPDKVALRYQAAKILGMVVDPFTASDVQTHQQLS